jgi:5'-nucleotidase
MAYALDGKMVIGVSSRALFDLTVENQIFEEQGLDAYQEYQISHENEVLGKGPGFSLIKNLLALNELLPEERPVEVIIMSRNSTNTSLRVFNSIKHYGLDITRAVLVSGAQLSPYLKAFRTDLFLSAYEDDVQNAIDSGIAAGIICTDHIYEEREDGSIRIAFDGDAVIFDDSSELVYKQGGLKAFEENEARNADTPLEEGPFAGFLRKLSAIQEKLGPDNCPIRTALVTSRNAPAHERVIKTLRAWNVRLDEALFLGGIEKKDFLKAFGAQIFFDDQSVHTLPASEEVPSARVPYRGGALGGEEGAETAVNGPGDSA